MMLALLLDSLMGVSPAAALGLLFCLMFYTDSLHYDSSPCLVEGLGLCQGADFRAGFAQKLK